VAKVIILCGMIASGKTYYANQLKTKTGAVILSVDELLLQLSDSCLGELHDDIAFRCEHYLYGLAEQLTAMGRDVVIDYGYWLKKERDAARQYFRSRNIPMELHYFIASEEIRKKRLKQRNKALEEAGESISRKAYYIDEELRQRLDMKFEEPSKDETDRLIMAEHGNKNA
jgi:predicted kinase